MSHTDDKDAFVTNTGEHYPTSGHGADADWPPELEDDEGEAAPPEGYSAEAPDELLNALDQTPARPGILRGGVGKTCGIAMTAFHDTTDPPYRKICKLYIQYSGRDGWYAGSGFFLGRGTVITSGHNLFDWDESKSWASRIAVIPGKDGDTMPYSGQVVKSTFVTLKGWKDHGEWQYDYGAIIMPDHKLGDRVGFFGAGSYSADTLMAASTTVSGYPSVDGSSSTLYRSPGDGAGGTLAGVDEDFLTYTYDTSGGESGSPVWFFKDNGSVRAVGIHRGGSPGRCPNTAVRINDKVFKNLIRFKAQGG